MSSIFINEMKQPLAEEAKKIDRFVSTSRCFPSMFLGGAVRRHLLKGGIGAADGSVYLFSETGSYLSGNTRTAGGGIAAFDNPEGRYKFRADYGGEK